MTKQINLNGTLDEATKVFDENVNEVIAKYDKENLFTTYNTMYDLINNAKPVVQVKPFTKITHDDLPNDMTIAEGEAMLALNKKEHKLWVIVRRWNVIDAAFEKIMRKFVIESFAGMNLTDEKIDAVISLAEDEGATPTDVASHLDDNVQMIKKFIA